MALGELDTEFFFAKHNDDERPEFDGRNVFILDFSYSREELLRINEVANSLVVLDHHASAQKELDDLPFCTFDMNRSGAGLTWDHFYPSRLRPWIVEYVEDRDLWEWCLPNSRDINAALSLEPFEFETWDRLKNVNPDAISNRGAAVNLYKKRLVERAIINTQRVRIDTHEVDAVNTNVLDSEIGNALALSNTFGVVWRVQGDGRYRYSFRSAQTSSFDVSELAQKFGGGGHKKAAGCITDGQIHEVV
jgi:oligoribonuclease NrnB/cAMP/cGMP phosphodiesterase (DHH superfamily)